MAEAPDLLGAVRQVTDEMVAGVGACVVNMTAQGARLPPRIVAQLVPGLAHTHEPTPLPRVPGCLFCARSGNKVAEFQALPEVDKRDAVGNLQMPFFRAILDTYDQLLDLVRLHAGACVEAEVAAVRRQVVDPMRLFVEACEETFSGN